jgi:hypothetical protein
MDSQAQSRAPLFIAIVLLLLTLYVGSYLALVVPRPSVGGFALPGNGPLRQHRIGSSNAWRLYWPLEQIDRKVRPKTWEAEFWNVEYYGHASPLP